MHLKDGQSSYTPPMDPFMVLDHVGNNYLNKDFQNIPLTCALITSIIVNSQKKTTTMPWQVYPPSRGVAHCPIANGVPDSRQP